MFARLLIPGFLAAAYAWGQAAGLTAPDQILAPGQAAVIPLTLASAGQSVAAIEFDIQWDQPLALQITAGDQLRAASKLPFVISVAPQTLRCLIAGFNQAPLADGELLILFLAAGPAAAPGTAQVRILNISAADPGSLALAFSPSTIQVQIQNGGTLPLLPQTAVLNAATLSPAPLAPGEIITVLGFSAPVSLAINGTPAPVLYSGVSQVNAVVPFALDVTAPAAMQLKNSSQTLSLSVPVAAVAPGIFSTAGTGLGTGAILNADNSVNSFDNPAPAGSVVMVFGTGFGALASPLADGQPAGAADSTVLPVTATVAGIPAEVAYAGAAPGLVAGVIQVNLNIPAGAAHNLSAPVILSVNGAATAGGITVAVQ